MAEIQRKLVIKIISHVHEQSAKQNESFNINFVELILFGKFRKFVVVLNNQTEI